MAGQNGQTDGDTTGAITSSLFGDDAPPQRRRSRAAPAGDCGVSTACSKIEDVQRTLSGISERLNAVEGTLLDLKELVAVKNVAKEFYATAEVATILGRAEFTVREWCRQHRCRATKKACGRGEHGEWLIAHDELTRLKSEGLLPSPA